MNNPLSTYTAAGVRAGTASNEGDTREADAHRAWAALAIAMEYEPDQILAQHAFDTAYRRVRARHIDTITANIRRSA